MNIELGCFINKFELANLRCNISDVLLETIRYCNWNTWTRDLSSYFTETIQICILCNIKCCIEEII